MINRRTTPLLLLLLVLILLALIRCQPAPDDQPRAFPDPQQNDAQSLPPGSDLPQVTLRPGQTIVPDQLLVSGAGGDIDRVIGELPELALEQVASASYEYLDRYPPPDTNNPDIRQQTQGKRLSSPSAQTPGQLRLDLYTTTSASPPLPDVLQAIGDKVDEIGDELQRGVVAEPNYLSGFEISGNPWAIEGSPWAIEGSPWAIEGSGESTTGDDLHASDSFWQQWALRPVQGINLYEEDAAPTQRNIDGDGAGVQIAIFDTSPFSAEGGYRFDGWGPPEMSPLALTVSHPVALPTSQSDAPVNISDHGLFVAGLAYAAAPAADLHLIRVLNDEGQGTLQALVDALNIYMRERLAAQGSLQNTVINLSLGMAQPTAEELPPAARQAIARMIARWDGRAVDEDNLPILSLELSMQIADAYGASVIAAAGNDSAEAATPLPAQLPAAYDTVVGVEAANQTPTRSCYSNSGDLRAPGGDGDEDVDSGATCVPAHNSCPTTDGNCPHGVISYTLVAHKGFAYWVGSSFATPLVSGLSAALIQAQPAQPPATVHSTLLCAASATGLLDAVAAFSCP